MAKRVRKSAQVREFEEQIQRKLEHVAVNIQAAEREVAEAQRKLDMAIAERSALQTALDMLVKPS